MTREQRDELRRKMEDTSRMRLASPAVVLALLDALDAAEARAADARRAALEEAAAYLDEQAVLSRDNANDERNTFMPEDFWRKLAKYERQHADAIRALAASDHATEDTDDCLCGACLGGETCAERE